MESNQGAGRANRPDTGEVNRARPQDQKPDGDLAISATGERIYHDAADPSQADIQRLYRAWAEVGRAILARRKERQ